MQDEPDQLAGLPERYSYIRDVVLKYTRGGRASVEKWRSTVNALSYKELAEIADVYRLMAKQNDAPDLSTWIKERTPGVWLEWERWQELRNKAEDEGLPRPPEPQQEPRAKRIFELFEYLQERGVGPFNSGQVEFCPPQAILDWSKLPPELEYLRVPANEYGILFGDEQRLRMAKFIKRRRPKEFQELKELAARTRAPGEQKQIQEFLHKYRIDFHPEASRVFYLMALLWELVP